MKKALLWIFYLFVFVSISAQKIAVKTNILYVYFKYITDDILAFVYEEILTDCLNDLDLNNYAKKETLN